MNALYTYLRSFVRQDEGQDLLEYALLITLIAIFCITAVQLAGTNIAGYFAAVTADLF
jgi:Flp pilus assembly pilin Flp